eukprot:2327230-Pleurochrysis_carterae.AAC.2
MGNDYEREGGRGRGKFTSRGRKAEEQSRAWRYSCLHINLRSRKGLMQHRATMRVGLKFSLTHDSRTIKGRDRPDPK